jgi:hypothetical protein
MCATGSRCANAHLPRPAGDRKREARDSLATAKVAVLASADRFASGSPLRLCDHRLERIKRYENRTSAIDARLDSRRAAPL